MKITNKYLKRIVAEETESALFEETQKINRKTLLIAAAIFANKYVKGKEGQQIPTTMVIRNAEAVGDYFTGGKPGKENILKRGKKGAVTSLTTRIHHNKGGDHAVKLLHNAYKTKQNKMNNMLDAVSGVLEFARGNSNSLNPDNPYIKKIQDMAKNITPNINQYTKWIAIGMKTMVAGDTYMESTHDGIRKAESESLGGETESRRGSKQERNVLSTTVDYLTGPLETQKAGSFAGLQVKAKAQHDKYAAVFGDKGVLGTIRNAFRPKELGGADLDDESPGEFRRRLKKATRAS